MQEAIKWYNQTINFLQSDTKAWGCPPKQRSFTETAPNETLNPVYTFIAAKYTYH
jgi:hypothetical protein